MKDRYVGPLKIADVVDEENGIVTVVFENETRQTLMKKTFEIIVSDEQKDWNYVQQKKFDALGKEVMAVIFSYDLYTYEVEGLISYLVGEIKGRINRALNFLWTKDDKKFIPNTDPTDMFTLVEAENIIKNIPDGTK